MGAAKMMSRTPWFVGQIPLWRPKKGLFFEKAFFSAGSYHPADMACNIKQFYFKDRRRRRGCQRVVYIEGQVVKLIEVDVDEDGADYIFLQPYGPMCNESVMQLPTAQIYSHLTFKNLEMMR
jgi:hypothetical protein